MPVLSTDNKPLPSISTFVGIPKPKSTETVCSSTVTFPKLSISPVIDISLISINKTLLSSLKTSIVSGNCSSNEIVPNRGISISSHSESMFHVP